MNRRSNIEGFGSTESRTMAGDLVENVVENEKNVTEQFKEFIESVVRDGIMTVRKLTRESDEKIADMISESMKGGIDLSIFNKANEAAKPAKGILINLQDRYRRFLPVFFSLGLAGQLERLTHPPVDASFGRRQEAAVQLRETGITDERADAYSPGVSEVLNRSVLPFAYQSVSDIIFEAPENLISNHEKITRVALGSEPSLNQEWHYDKSQHQDREDAWRLYLGLPQEYGTFGISDFQPEGSKDDVYYYKINDWLEKYSASRAMSAAEREQIKPIKLIVDSIDLASQIEIGEDLDRLINGVYIPRLNQDITRAPGQSIIVEDIRKYTTDNQGGGIMGNFRFSKGHDSKGLYVSYYDNWDLGPTIEGENGLFGKPFEIYDRIYYDPTTFDPIEVVL